MALHISSISIKTVVEEKRFNPKYFRFFSKRNELMKKSKLNFKKMGEKGIMDLITDGEHMAINLYEKDEKNADIRYLYVHNIKTGIIDIIDSEFISLKDHKRLAKSQLHNGDIIISVVGTIGRSALVGGYLNEANIPRNIAKIVVNKNKIKYPEFLASFFLSQFGKEQAFFTSGGNIQGLLSLTKLKTMYVPIVEESIQKKFFELYSKAIEKEIESLSLINEAIKYFYEKAGIDFKKIKKENYFQTNNSDLRKNDLWTPILYNPKFIKIEKEIEKKWPVKKIGVIFDDKKGNEVGSENYNNFIFKNKDDVPFIRTSDFGNYQIDFDPDYHVDKKIFDELKQNLKFGDILFTNDGKIGEVSIVTNPKIGIIQSHIKKLTVKKGVTIDPFYVFIPLILDEIGKAQVKKFTLIQSTIPTIAKRIKEIKIPIIDKDSMEHISKLIQKAFQLKHEKDELFKKIKKDMNELLQYE